MEEATEVEEATGMEEATEKKRLLK